MLTRLPQWGLCLLAGLLPLVVLAQEQPNPPRNVIQKEAVVVGDGPRGAGVGWNAEGSQAPER